MNDYERKQEERRQRLERAAGRASGEAESRFRRARDAVRGIEPGQPILVGHYSEKRHRKALERHDANMRKGFEATDRARELGMRAAAVGSGGVSSDDPDAVAKLTEKLDTLRAERETAKRQNAAYRKRDAATLAALGLDLAALDAALATAYSWDRQPVAKYRLTNLGAEIRRLEKRIGELAALRATPATEPVSLGAVRVEEDAEANRVLVIFPREKVVLREALKARGFRWTPSLGAWTRKRGTGVFALALSIARAEAV